MSTVVQKIVVSIGIACSLFACAEAAREARQITYAPNFQYIDRQQIRSVMSEMAVSVDELNTILRRQGLNTSDRMHVLELLEKIKASSSRLETSNLQTNHPEFGATLDAFRQDVSAAINSVKAEPASYFLAGSIVGACFYCHGRK